LFTLVNSAKTVYGFVYVFGLEGGTLFKDFPFFPPPLFTPHLPSLFVMSSLSLLHFPPPQARQERENEKPKKNYVYVAIKEREKKGINHTFYIFLNKPVGVLLLSIINCYSLQRSSLANLFLNKKKRTLKRRSQNSQLEMK
jgi:hypothetical protein